MSAMLVGWALPIFCRENQGFQAAKFVGMKENT
jgi:hypothetical protein